MGTGRLGVTRPCWSGSPLPIQAKRYWSYLDFYESSRAELARRTGLTSKTISGICDGRASITPSIALALEPVLGRPAHFWLNLQMTFGEV